MRCGAALIRFSSINYVYRVKINFDIESKVLCPISCLHTREHIRNFNNKYYKTDRVGDFFKIKNMQIHSLTSAHSNNKMLLETTKTADNADDLLIQ